MTLSRFLLFFLFSLHLITILGCTIHSAQKCLKYCYEGQGLFYSESTYKIDLKQSNSVSISIQNQSGEPINSCSISPALPAGLSITSNCEIQGTPTVASAEKIYLVKATTQSYTFDIQISIAIDLGKGLPDYDQIVIAYSFQNLNQKIVTGTNCKVFPNLPDGLALSSDCLLTGRVKSFSKLSNHSLSFDDNGVSKSEVLRIDVRSMADPNFLFFLDASYATNTGPLTSTCESKIYYLRDLTGANPYIVDSIDTVNCTPPPSSSDSSPTPDYIYSGAYDIYPPNDQNLNLNDDSFELSLTVYNEKISDGASTIRFSVMPINNSCGDYLTFDISGGTYTLTATDCLGRNILRSSGDFEFLKKGWQSLKLQYFPKEGKTYIIANGDLITTIDTKINWSAHSQVQSRFYIRQYTLNQLYVRKNFNTDKNYRTLCFAENYYKNSTECKDSLDTFLSFPIVAYNDWGGVTSNTIFEDDCFPMTFQLNNKYQQLISNNLSFTPNQANEHGTVVYQISPNPSIELFSSPDCQSPSQITQLEFPENVHKKTIYANSLASVLGQLSVTITNLYGTEIGTKNFTFTNYPKPTKAFGTAYRGCDYNEIVIGLQAQYSNGGWGYTQVGKRNALTYSTTGEIVSSGSFNFPYKYFTPLGLSKTINFSFTGGGSLATLLNSTLSNGGTFTTSSSYDTCGSD